MWANTGSQINAQYPPNQWRGNYKKGGSYKAQKPITCNESNQPPSKIGLQDKADEQPQAEILKYLREIT